MALLIGFCADLIISCSRDKLPLNTVGTELTDSAFCSPRRTTLPVFRGVLSGESCELYKKAAFTSVECTTLR